ncbi:MAG: hypothetical protein KAG84_01775 [Bacteroidales bacterium]|nr:hypothetical protein [Bacteroidales bacterium]
MQNSETYYNEDLEGVIWKITGDISYFDFRSVAEITHLLRERNSSSKQINNIISLEFLSDEIIEYIYSVYFPRAIESGLKYFAFLIPDNNTGKQSMNIANKGAAKKYNIEIEYFSNKSEAFAWLKSK